MNATLIAVALVSALALPFLLLSLIFDNWYSRLLRTTRLAGAPGPLPCPTDFAHSANRAPLELYAMDATTLADTTDRGAMEDASARTVAMRRVFVAAGTAYAIGLAVLIWRRSRHWDDLAVPVLMVHYSTLLPLFLVLVFTRAAWQRWLACGVAWFLVGYLVFAGLRGRLWVPPSVVLNGLELWAIPFAAVAWLTLRTVRPLLAGIFPLVTLLLVAAAGLVSLLAWRGLDIAEGVTPRATVLGALAALVGIPLAIWSIRRERPRLGAALLAAALAVAGVGFAMRPGLAPVTLAAVGVNGLCTLALWLACKVFLRLKANGRLTDELLHFSLCWVPMTPFVAVLAQIEEPSYAWLLLPIVAGAARLWLGLRWARRDMPRASAKRLLLLRVFDSSRRQRRRLLDALDDSWRRVGRIDLVAGADLGAWTLQAVTFEAILAGRVYRQFIRNRADGAERIAALPAMIAADGRYPLNELHCLPDTWRDVVTTLALGADIVLMDLRGLHATSHGARFELAFLVAHVPLGRVVLLIDRTTNRQVLAETADCAWTTLPHDSPNAALLHPRLMLIECEGAPSVDAIRIACGVFRDSDRTTPRPAFTRHHRRTPS